MPSKNDLVGHRNPRRFRRNTSIFSTGTAHGANYPSANGTFRVFIGIDRMMTRPASCGAIIHFISSLLENISSDRLIIPAFSNLIKQIIHHVSVNPAPTIFALMPQIFHKLRISSNSKKEKSPEALNFLGILVAEEGFEPTTFGLWVPLLTFFIVA